MKAIRKIIINQKEIDSAVQLNTQLIYEHQGQRYAPQVEVPIPQFGTVQFNFRPHNVQDWFIESSKEKDIICNLLYKGEVRLEYDPLVETQLEAIFSA